MDVGCFVFFFKQKTAYEMRISDWSSDVCSSDLEGAVEHAERERLTGLDHAQRDVVLDSLLLQLAADQAGGERRRVDRHAEIEREIGQRPDMVLVPVGDDDRSEEHTSELQSLMRISYAVFCLKKKNTPSTNSRL